MTYDPEKNAPRKLDLQKIRAGLSAKQMDKIKYECNLLKKDIQELLYIAPHLFTEGVTAANTAVIKEEEEKSEVFKPSTESQSPYGGYYEGYDSYDNDGFPD